MKLKQNSLFQNHHFEVVLHKKQQKHSSLEYLGYEKPELVLQNENILFLKRRYDEVCEVWKVSFLQ
jgi:hypothetical protein